MKAHVFILAGLVAALQAVAVNPAAAVERPALPLNQLVVDTQIHAMSVDRRNPSRLFLATHAGLFRLAPNGLATQLSAGWDFHWLSSPAGDCQGLWALGRRVGEQRPILLRSGNGGRVWSPVVGSDQALGDLRFVTAGGPNGDMLYGVGTTLQVSRDGGASWSFVSDVPRQLVGLTASAKFADRLYAATRQGLLLSRNGGRDWLPLLPNASISAAEAGGDGTLYVFVRGRGLMWTREEDVSSLIGDPGRSKFKSLGGVFVDDFLTQLVVSPENQERLYGLTGRGDVLTSGDRGGSWVALSRF